ncbi:hypothetical protein BJ322DRAFT_1180497 [Thelephora terrestris]|uniref:SET domain-containing protein n=1 Tax=Thelephora terrestris TaxID=56493 RepID=A0A9P6HJ06_9AGAM|nr:hypothetical protein BJ322DRAFT_1180497 [Thelephora terrestris]
MADTSPFPPPSLQDIEALVLEVFSRVWEEFNAADTEYCETTIGSLAAPSVAQDTTRVVKSESTAALLRDMKHLGSRASRVGISTSGSSILHIPRVCRETNVQTFILPPAVEPCTQYESWTPTNRSIFRGDDSDDMQFLPFADEHAFNKKAYGKFFKTLAWQGGEQMDADLEPVVLEAAHRLYFDYGIELERIDEANFVEVIKSRWGFGVALLEPVGEDEFIIEYTGELVFPTSVDFNRQFLGDYIGRKYTYTLNGDICIDAANAGNPSRFINHAERPNCYAQVTFVNDEQRIGIFSTHDLQEGTELFLDYGEDFFKEVYTHGRDKPPPGD